MSQYQHEVPSSCNTTNYLSRIPWVTKEQYIWKVRYDKDGDAYHYKFLEEHAYKSINERSKVRYLISGIKYGALNYVKATILASKPYIQYYDASVILYKDYIKKEQDTNAKLYISGVGTRASELSGEGTFTDKIEDKYYKKAL